MLKLSIPSVALLGIDGAAFSSVQGARHFSSPKSWPRGFSFSLMAWIESFHATPGHVAPTAESLFDYFERQADQINEALAQGETFYCVGLQAWDMTAALFWNQLESGNWR